jgi:hypothetical protein
MYAMCYSGALEYMIGEWYSWKDVIHRMRRGGVDLFPEVDTFVYVEGAPFKNIVLERHLYHCISLLSTTHTFTWSR